MDVQVGPTDPRAGSVPILLPPSVWQYRVVERSFPGGRQPLRQGSQGQSPEYAHRHRNDDQGFPEWHTNERACTLARPTGSCQLVCACTCVFVRAFMHPKLRGSAQQRVGPVWEICAVARQCCRAAKCPPLGHGPCSSVPRCDTHFVPFCNIAGKMCTGVLGGADLRDPRALPQLQCTRAQVDLN